MFEEGSIELAREEEEGRAVRPAIARFDDWPTLQKYVVQSIAAGASRGHVYLRKDTPQALIELWVKRYVRCSNPECTNKFPAIRKHKNGDGWSIHVSGPIDDGHGRCRHRIETKRSTQWLYLVTRQANRSPRIRKATEDARQALLRINAKNELEIL